MAPPVPCYWGSLPSSVTSSALRKHSCGDPEACTLPSPPLHHMVDDSQVNLLSLRRWNVREPQWPPAIFI